MQNFQQKDLRQEFISTYHLETMLKIDDKDLNFQRLICVKCKGRDSGVSSFIYSNTLKHLKSSKHNDAIKDPNEKILLQQVIQNLENQKKSQVSTENVKQEPLLEKSLGIQHRSKDKTKLNFMIGEFIVQNRLPFSIAPKVLSFIQDINSSFPFSLVQTASISKTTATKIIQVCIAGTLKSKIFNQLKSSPFSLSIDASSDKFGANYLAIFDKYLESDDSKESVTKLISITKMGTSYTGEKIFAKLQEEVLFDKEIAKNFV